MILRVSGRRTGRLLLQVLVASLCAYLAWLSAIALQEQLPHILLAAATTIRVDNFDPSLVSPGWETRMPQRAARGLFAVYQMIGPAWGLVLLVLGPRLVRRSRGWSSIFLTQLSHAVGFRVAVQGAILSYAGLFYPWYPAPFNGVGWASSRPFRFFLGLIIAAGACCLVYRINLRFLERAGSLQAGRFQAMLRWVLVPALVCAGFLASLMPSLRYFRMTIAAATVLVFLLVTVFPAVRRPRMPAPAAAHPPAPARAGAGAIAMLFLLAIGGLMARAAYEDRQRHNRNTEQFEVFPAEASTLHLQRSLLRDRSGEEWAALQDGRVRFLAARLGIPPPTPSLRIILYESVLLKRSVTGSDTPYTLVPERRELHTLVPRLEDAEDTAGQALLLMYMRWGPPASDTVARAIGRYASGRIHGSSLDEYAARIVQEEGFHTLSEVLGLDPRFFSPMVRDALGGAWVGSLVERHGTEILSRLYSMSINNGRREVFARTLGQRWSGLEADWRAEQDRLLGTTLSAREPRPKGLFFQRGVTFTQRGYSTGYGSERAAEQLAALRVQGVDTVTLVPYAETRAPRETAIEVAADSRDDRLIRTLQAARRVGLRRILKPHLSIGDGFVGNISFEDSGKFRAWFENYRRWMLHYARIAELFDAEGMVVGTELAGVTRYEQDWRTLIGDVRRIYSGPLTYAAHWGKDFETLAFWDALDYLGVNMYYPLGAIGEEPRADSPAIQSLVAKFSAMAARTGKQVVFTEVGFPNTSSAAAEPYRKTGGLMDLELQARCVRTVFEAFYGRPWFGGMNWWEWPTTGQAGSFYETYILSGNPAADVMAEWYSRGRVQ